MKSPAQRKESSKLVSAPKSTQRTLDPSSPPTSGPGQLSKGSTHLQESSSGPLLTEECKQWVGGGKSSRECLDACASLGSRPAGSLLC